MTAPEPTPTPVPPAPPIWINDPVIILPVCPTPLPESGPCAEEFPPPLPLDPLPDSGEPVTIQPDPAPDFLAETGPLETGLALVLAVAAIAAGVRLALGRRA